MKPSHIILLLIYLCYSAGCLTIKTNRENTEGPSQSSAEAPRRSSTDAPPRSSLDRDDAVHWADKLAKVAGRVFVGSEEGIIFYAFDTLTEPNRPVDLTVKLQSVKFKNYRDITIAYYLDSTFIASAKTDNNGLASISWKSPTTGDYRFLARIDKVPDKNTQALLDADPVSLLVAVRKREEPFVVIDLDHTLVDSSFFKVLLGGGEPMADSVEITHKIAKDYSLIYLTHRPDLMTQRGKAWLQEHGYPTAPLIVSQLREAIGSSGEFKTARLSTIREAFTNMQIGIGDKVSDAQAYVDNGMTAFLIPHFDQTDPEEMQELAWNIRDFRGKEHLNVVSNWPQIEAGIFRGQKFLPENFANWLETRARRLQAQKERQEREDDYDD